MNRKDLTQPDRELLERVLSISPENLTDNDINILFARREYLTKEEAKTYAEVIKAKTAQVEEEANPKEETKEEVK